MLKKMMLLAVAAAAIAAFAVPASASAADVWTANGNTLEEGQKATQSYEGVLQFSNPSPPFPVPSSFACEVTVRIDAEGPSGGVVKTFSPTTKTCVGTGLFEGCVLKEDFSNIAEGWNIDVATTPAATVKHANALKNLTIRNVYEPGCFFEESHLEFKSVNVIAAGTNPITSLSIEGTATNGFTKASGTIKPETPLEGDSALGIEVEG